MVHAQEKTNYPKLDSDFSSAASAHQSKALSPEECKKRSKPPVDLRAGFGPIRDQGQLGWCYSYAATDQLNYWMVKNNIPGVSMDGPNRLSPAAGAIGYDAKERNLLYGKMLGQIEELKESSTKLESLQTELNDLSQKRNQTVEVIKQKDPNAVKMMAEINQVTGQLQAASAGTRSETNLVIGKAMTANVEELASQFKILSARLTDLIRTKPEILQIDRQMGSIQGKIAALRDLQSLPVPEVSVEPGGGYASELLNSMLMRGACLEKDVSSLDNQSGYYKFKDLNDVLNHRMKNYYANPNEENLCNTADGLHLIFPGQNINDIKAVLRDFRSIDPLQSLLTRSCQPVVLPSNKLPTVKTFSGADEGVPAINESLDRGFPVSIDVKTAKMFPSPEGSYGSVSADAQHAVLVVGKKLNCSTGQTEYLVRNSWGSNSCLSNLHKFAYLQRLKPGPSVKIYEACINKCALWNQPDTEVAEVIANLVVDCQVSCQNDLTDSISKSAPAGSLPYTCDDGYFVINENKVRESLVRATTLE